MEDFSGHFFPQKREKSGDKIREEIRWPKKQKSTKNPFCQKPTLVQPPHRALIARAGKKTKMDNREMFRLRGSVNSIIYYMSEVSDRK